MRLIEQVGKAVVTEMGSYFSCHKFNDQYLYSHSHLAPCWSSPACWRRHRSSWTMVPTADIHKHLSLSTGVTMTDRAVEPGPRGSVWKSKRVQIKRFPQLGKKTAPRTTAVPRVLQESEERSTQRERRAKNKRAWAVHVLWSRQYRHTKFNGVGERWGNKSKKRIKCWQGVEK